MTGRESVSEEVVRGGVHGPRAVGVASGGKDQRGGMPLPPGVDVVPATVDAAEVGDVALRETQTSSQTRTRRRLRKPRTPSPNEWKAMAWS
jgi:hypothetical protein